MNYDLKRNEEGKFTLDIHMEFKTSTEAFEVISKIESNVVGILSLTSLEIELIPMLKESKLQAVKHYKDKTGEGLRESKDYCDNLQEKLIKMQILEKAS